MVTPIFRMGTSLHNISYNFFSCTPALFLFSYSQYSSILLVFIIICVKALFTSFLVYLTEQKFNPLYTFFSTLYSHISLASMSFVCIILKNFNLRLLYCWCVLDYDDQNLLYLSRSPQ